MSSTILQNNIYWQLFRVAINAKHNLMSLAEQYSLTVMQMYTLCLLESDTAIPMNALTSLLYCDASNVTGIVDRLFNQKYIKRDENPQDRRAKLIKLTPKGAKLCEKISSEMSTFKKDYFKGLSDKEQEQFLSLLLKTSLPSLTTTT